MGLKEIYHSAEDGWYSTLDKIDNTIPVYRIVDPIDKVVPSFALFLIAILALLFVFVGMPLLGGSNTDVVLSFKDEQGNPVQGLSVLVEYTNFSQEKTTNSLGNIPLSNVPLNTSISVTAQSASFDDLFESKSVDSPHQQLLFTLALKKAPQSELSFQFTDLGGLSLSGKSIFVQLSCVNGTPVPQSTYTISDGVLSVTPPAACDSLVGTISANGYVKKEGVLFTVANPIIQLQGVNIEHGKVKVTVRDAETNAILPDMDVELISHEGVSIQSITTNSFGVSIFSEVPVGDYYASVTDGLSNYALKTSDTITVLANQTVATEVLVSKQVQGTITVIVNDKSTGSPVTDAVVKLVGKADNKLYATKSITSTDSSLTFELTDKGPFIVTAAHPNYLAQTKDIGTVSGDQTVTFALEKLTATNSGKITVNVADEDGFPVDNAQVILYDSSTGFIAQAYDPKITDYNGNANFTGVDSGSYFARATKYPAGPSDSAVFVTDKSIPFTSKLVLKIGLGTVQVKVQDVEGTPVPFALVEFLTDGSDECSPGKCSIQSDAEGIATKAFKADRKVYVKVSAPGFSGYASVSHQLYAGKTELIVVKLPKTILGDTPHIQFVDVKDPITGTSAKEIKSGKAYLAIFQLQIPTALNLDNAGVHIRVGDEELAENDSIHITQVNIPNTSILKGNSYQPLEGYETDQENLTNGESKWINAEWNDPSPGVYEFGVVVRANDDVSVLEPLTIYYRSWGIKDGKWLRDPVDSQLGQSASAAGKDGQYAEAYQKIYYSGKPIVCDEDFCYSGESILNVDDELLIDGPPYSTSVNKHFDYSFVLTSASPITYQNPRLRVFASEDGVTPADGLSFTDYKVIGTSGQPIEAFDLATNDIPGGEGQGLSVGELKQYQTISGTFSFIAKQVGAQFIVVQLISDGEIVFEKSVDADVFSANSLSLNVSPDTASAFVPTEFTIKVTDSQGFDVQDAIVSLLKIDPNKNQQFVVKKSTDPTGKVTIIAPPSLPYTHFVFDATKGGYASDPVEIIVDENIVKFVPPALSFSLPNAPNTEQFLPLDITNLSQESLLLTKTTITGDFQGFLSNGEMQNYIKQYQNTTSLGAVQTKTIQVKASTSPVVNVVSNKDLTGNLTLTFKSVSSAQEWVQNVPLNVNIKVITDCDEGGIQISGAPGSGEIETTAFDSKAQVPFQLANTCIVDGQAFPLKNLKAKVVWKSNPIGNVEMALSDIEASNQSVEVLKNGTYVTLFDEFRPVDETEYEGILTFTPFPQNIGETAQFTVTLSGELGSGTKTKTISETFNMKIKVTNLETCVKFDPEPEKGIVLSDDSDQVDLKVDTTACGKVPVDLLFCAGTNNSNCSGGAPEGKLFLSQYTADNVTGSKTITVERKGGTLPGAYDLTVDARVPGGSYHRIAAVNVFVESDETYAFALDKADFVLYQKGAKDSATVTNRLFQESVQVTASVCDWGTASEGGFGSSLGKTAVVAVGVAQIVAFLGPVGPILGPYIGALGFCPVCLAIGIIVAILIDVIFSEDPCADDLTQPLLDYVINLAGGEDQDKLPPDAVTVKLSNNVKSDISAEWMVDVANVGSKKGKVQQTVGVIATNKSGFSDPNPLFGVMTLVSKIHDNGDPSHSGQAHVFCDADTFGPFSIGPTASEGKCKPANDEGIHQEAFHVKFRTQEVDQSLPNLTFDTVACVSGTSLGVSGKGALPKVAFNWGWNDQSGIPMKACDASNPNAVYCDATQFNIDMMKRLKKLDEFLAANNYTFSCPDNPSPQTGSANYPNPNPIISGFIGLSERGFAVQSTSSVKFTGKLENKTTASQEISMKVTMKDIEAEEVEGEILPSCTVSATLVANSSQSVECVISSLSNKTYLSQFALTSTTTSNIAYQSNDILIDLDGYNAQTQGTCEDLPKSTAVVGGKPIINLWIDKDDSETGSGVNDNTVTFTPDVPNVQALTDLLHYDTYLIRDGYSHDFENDFRDYYSANFADAPPWFKGGNGTAGFNAFYGDDDSLYFTNKFFDDPTLPAAGKYQVNINVFFDDNWQMLSATGEPKAHIAIDFYHLETPSPNSPFYRLPFDGALGLENTTYDRVGYGVEYINAGADPIKINDTLIQTYSGEGSTALGQLTVSESTDLRKLNSIPSTRGNILEVVAPSGSAEQSMTFTPSLATPLLMRVNHEVTPNPFSAYYQLGLNGVPQDTGNTLTFWEGAGNCYDFTGTPIYEKFNYSPDRAGLPTDKYTSWPYLYAVDWDKALVGGNAYLRTIFYTPADGTYSLNGEAGTSKFITANYPDYSSTQLLDGITTMPYNNASTAIDSIQDVFDLVGQGKICVSDSGAKARFFWNPETIYKQTGQTSISAVTNQLKAGKTCLGAPGSK